MQELSGVDEIYNTMAAIFFIFISCVLLFVSGQEHHKHWDPPNSELDLGEHASVIGVNDAIKLLHDSQHGVLAIKDFTFDTCLLVNLRTSHMTANEIIHKIENEKVPLIHDQFRISYPPIEHHQLMELAGHRVFHFCHHNTNVWLQKA